MPNDGLGYAAGGPTPIFQLLSGPTPTDETGRLVDPGTGQIIPVDSGDSVADANAAATYQGMPTGLPAGTAPAPMSIWDFLTQPVVFGIPLYGVIAIAAAAGLGYYMFIYSAGKKR